MNKRPKLTPEFSESPGCNGKHARLVWRRSGPVPITNQPMEILYASGFLNLATEIGFCSRCGHAIEWRS